MPDVPAGEVGSNVSVSDGIPGWTVYLGGIQQSSCSTTTCLLAPQKSPSTAPSGIPPKSSRAATPSLSALNRWAKPLEAATSRASQKQSRAIPLHRALKLTAGRTQSSGFRQPAHSQGHLDIPPAPSPQKSGFRGPNPKEAQIRSPKGGVEPGAGRSQGERPFGFRASDLSGFGFGSRIWQARLWWFQRDAPVTPPCRLRGRG